MRTSCTTPLVALGLVASLAAGGAGGGCSRGPQVPEGAKLIWYGQSNFYLPLNDLPGGTYYVCEEASGKTIRAAYCPRGGSIHFGGLKDGRNYRLYFVEGSLGPATQPAAAAAAATTAQRG